jgi:Holliday junction resolvasome RuvABC endonuclease subunit
MIFIGIDPGQSGAIAAINSCGAVVGVVKNKETERDLWEAIARFTGFPSAFAVIEHVHSMPKQGVASSFKFGTSYGFLRGLLIASEVRFTEVSPVKWQTAMKCRSKGDKNVTKARAQQLFPNVKSTHATADALLLAEYARVTWKEHLPVSESS